MVNQWFKFYGSEYLSDPKMLGLSASERSCWLTILCYASMNNGVVSHLGETTLMIQAGVSAENEEWEKTKGVLEKLERLKMISREDDKITLINWKKRQDTFLTSTERVRDFRERKEAGNEIETDKRYKRNTRGEEKRGDKNRIDKSIYLSNIPKEDIEYCLKRFIITERQLKSKAEDLLNYCKQKGRWYSDYRAFLINALKKDFKERDELTPTSKYKGL